MPSTCRYRTACTCSDGQIRGARRQGPLRASHHRCLTDVGRRMTGSEDHFPSAVSGHGQNCAPPVSKASRRKSLMRLFVGSASPGCGVAHCASLSWPISLRQRHYYYSPAVSGKRQPCAQVQFLAWGRCPFGSVEVPLSRVCHVGLHTVHVVNIASV